MSAPPASRPLASQHRAAGRAWLCAALASATPVLVFILMMAAKGDLIDRSLALDGLVLRWGVWLAIAGAAAAVVGALIAFRGGRAAWAPAALGIAAAALTVVGFGLQRGTNAPVAPQDVATSADDRPGFSGQVLAIRRDEGDAPIEALSRQGVCDLSGPVPTQVAPEVAGWALQQAGFVVRGFGVGRADGAHTGDFFGFQHDAVIRIRPGRTDVRVTAREARPADGGEACRLAQAIVDALGESL